MAKGFIDKFLNTESKESLENSESVIYLIKRKKIKQLRKEVDALVQEFNVRNKTKETIRTELEKLENQNFFKKVFHLKKLAMEKKRLKSMIDIENKHIDSLFLKLGPKYKEMVEIEKEVRAYEKSIRMYGLTLDDIEEEYEKALKNFENQEDSATEKVVSVSEESQGEITSSNSEEKDEKSTNGATPQKEA